MIYIQSVILAGRASYSPGICWTKYNLVSTISKFNLCLFLSIVPRAYFRARGTIGKKQVMFHALEIGRVEHYSFLLIVGPRQIKK